MNSAKSKKKGKLEKIPKPIKIKREDDHMMYPMAHYVDDRVELIRQIFSSLKPKTITNLAPDFLKKNKLEDIQEQCLSEILGISKKRLLSIINATKCPTDTDSSSDDDVNSIDEHISLEEISSDSDIADQKGTKTSKNDGKKKQIDKNTADNENNKQFSVLELLELQARARAIRSQLALEPVTKIEVDTDSEEEKVSTKLPTPKPLGKRLDRTTNGRQAATKPEKSKRPPIGTLTVTIPNGESASGAPSKRIKLKRNFRKHTRDEGSSDEAKKSEEIVKSPEKVDPKKEGRSRSPSPDVIPIIPVPETLCISDSDDDKKISETVKPSGSGQSIEILSVVNIEAPKTIEPPKNSEVESPQKPSTPIEPEEGEILEEEESTQAPTPVAEETLNTITEPNSNSDSNSSKNEESLIEEGSKKTEGEAASELGISGVETVIKSEQLTTSKEKPIPETNPDSPQKVDRSDSEDDANDDVISLEGGDLLNEMKEHLEEEEIEESKETRHQDDVICLDDSSDEETKDRRKTESWNERWLKSNKVSKVLAASRLGNRVRNKIKESKKATKLKEAAVHEIEQKPQEVFVSKHEDGSVEQYKELLEKMQKKTD